jgi:hypothetical protein
MKKKYTRFVVYLDEGDKPLLAELKKIAKKRRISVSALASYSIQVGLPIMEARFEKLAPEKKEVTK